VASQSGADHLVRGIRHMSARISRDDRLDSGNPLEDGLHAPEASPTERCLLDLLLLRRDGVAFALALFLILSLSRFGLVLLWRRDRCFSLFLPGLCRLPPDLLLDLTHRRYSQSHNNRNSKKDHEEALNHRLTP